MDENMKQMMEKLRGNPAMLQGLMQSRDGQALMQMLMQQGGGPALQQAAQAAARGNPAALTQLVQQVMQSPDGAELVNRISNATKK
jgi:hypothetical protein